MRCRAPRLRSKALLNASPKLRRAVPHAFSTPVVLCRVWRFLTWRFSTSDAPTGAFTYRFRHTSRFLSGTKSGKEPATYYSFCHGTDEDAATLILRESLIRPSKDDNEHVVSVGFFAQRTQGTLTRAVAETVIQKELKLSKGLQGALIVGEFRSRYQRHSAKWASCSEEQRICASTGVVRTSEKWTFCSARAHIMALAIPIAF